MFESLTSSLSSAINSLRGRGKLTEANMREGLAAVQTALLEADVAYDVADGFLTRVADGAVGAKVLESLDPPARRRRAPNSPARSRSRAGG